MMIYEENDDNDDGESYNSTNEGGVDNVSVIDNKNMMIDLNANRCHNNLGRCEENNDDQPEYIDLIERMH